MSNGADLPDDVELLKALLVEARSLLAERDVEIEQLKAQIDKLRRMQFGRKSEQLQRQIETLETQLEDLAAGRGVADVQRAQARGANASSSNATTDEAASRQALPAHLSREDHVFEPESSCPHRSAMGLCARRSSLGIRATRCGMVRILAEQARHPLSDSSHRLQWDPASGGLRGLR
jgi:hypothetical protein